MRRFASVISQCAAIRRKKEDSIVRISSLSLSLTGHGIVITGHFVAVSSFSSRLVINYRIRLCVRWMNSEKKLWKIVTLSSLLSLSPEINSHSKKKKTTMTTTNTHVHALPLPSLSSLSSLPSFSSFPLPSPPSLSSFPRLFHFLLRSVLPSQLSAPVSI